MAVKFKILKFEGPLDLLLQLVEERELQITEIALAEVTDQYLEYLEHSGKIANEELADFLLVASRLLYLKSRTLLPEISLGLEEEGIPLEAQLRMYKRFADAAKQIDGLIKLKRFTFAREKPPLPPGFFAPPKSLTAAAMREMMAELIGALRPILELPRAALARAVSIKEKIDEIRELLRRGEVSFKNFVRSAKKRTEVVVSFLALLELVKQRVAKVEQNELFSDITIGSAS
ncbi:hypothetical protein EPN90_04780 [Patescibacteria group bacterium]|nr:MAG: hypothetical protein EPN90_04780 [Patescibacteria group bacterium]